MQQGCHPYKPKPKLLMTYLHGGVEPSTVPCAAWSHHNIYICEIYISQCWDYGTDALGIYTRNDCMQTSVHTPRWDSNVDKSKPLERGMFQID